jgi:hypothetical protein
MRVGVKFCGSCNPMINTGALLRDLKARSDSVEFVGWADEGYDVLLILSGCEKDCATRPPFTGPLVVATNAGVNRWPVPASDIPSAILAALEAYDVG